jgi:hypothetical protein
VGLAGGSRLDLAAAGQVRRVMPGKPYTASRNVSWAQAHGDDEVEIDDGTAAAVSRGTGRCGQNREYSIALYLHEVKTCAIVWLHCGR